VGVAAALVQAGASSRTEDHRGRSPLDYAIESKNIDLQSLLLGKDLKKEAELSRELALPRRSEVDERRIMQVWERFFENAFKTFVEECDLDDGLVVDHQGLRSLEQRHRQGGAAGPGSGSDAGRAGKETKTHEETPIEVDAVLFYWDELVSSWFDWILCFDESQQEYFVIHRYEYNVMWLSEFLEYYDDSWLAPTEASGLPRTCYLACKDRWMQYYDPCANQCYWFEIYSGRCEHYLPLGQDYDAVVAAGLEPYEEVGNGEDRALWFMPCQHPCAFSWVAVYLPGTSPHADRAEMSVAESKYEPRESPEKEAPGNASSSKDSFLLERKYTENITNEVAYSASDSKTSESKSQEVAVSSSSSCCWGWYFFNYFSGHSSWSEPPVWAGLVAASWNGWWFCRDPESGSDYWYSYVPAIGVTQSILRILSLFSSLVCFCHRWNPETNESTY
jgi:hypothetical protein